MSKTFSSSFFIGLCLVALFGTVLFWVSQEVQKQNRLIASLSKQIAQEEETTAYLEAEWAYLNRPDRLEALLSMSAKKDVQPMISEIPNANMSVLPASKPEWLHGQRVAGLMRR